MVFVAYTDVPRGSKDHQMITGKVVLKLQGEKNNIKTH